MLQSLRHILGQTQTGAADVAGAGEQMLTACRRMLPVFDGRRRYDLSLSFKRVEQVRGRLEARLRLVLEGLSQNALKGFIDIWIEIWGMNFIPKQCLQ